MEALRVHDESDYIIKSNALREMKTSATISTAAMA